MDNAALPDRPMSTSEIFEQANKFVYNDKISLRNWIRAASSLLKQGNNYVRDGNYSQAYLILLRYSTLVLQYLSKHPEVKASNEGKRALKPLTSHIPSVLETLEFLKPQVNAAHEEWLRLLASQPDYSPTSSDKSQYDQLASRDAALSWNPKAPAKLLDVGENQDLAIDLAQKEIQRRDADRKATRQAGISEEEEHVRRSAGLWENWDAPPPRRRRDDGEDLRHSMDAARRRLDQSEQARRPPSSDTRAPSSQNYYEQAPSYQYPSISRSSPQQYSSSIPSDTYDRRPGPPPVRPPKPAERSAFKPPLRLDVAPPRPNKELLRPPYETPPPSDKQENKNRYTFRPAAYLENGEPIRPLFLPIGLQAEFLRHAEPNTKKGLEMCGILCGTLVNNALFISYLLIPKQTCSSDTCETDNEEEIMEFCMEEDLLIFGWIHTHPTQTCFMSSRDLHTQSGYQIMMPESIAIVCAPRSEPSYGIFRLTNPPGLPHILNCTQSSTFHQHEVTNLYTDARNPPGHVYHSGQLDFRTRDLRSSSRQK